MAVRQEEKAVWESHLSTLEAVYSGTSRKYYHTPLLSWEGENAGKNVLAVLGEVHPEHSNLRTKGVEEIARFRTKLIEAIYALAAPAYLLAHARCLSGDHQNIRGKLLEIFPENLLLGLGDIISGIRSAICNACLTIEQGREIMPEQVGGKAGVTISSHPLPEPEEQRKLVLGIPRRIDLEDASNHHDLRVLMEEVGMNLIESLGIEEVRLKPEDWKRIIGKDEITRQLGIGLSGMYQPSHRTFHEARKHVLIKELRRRLIGNELTTVTNKSVDTKNKGEFWCNGILGVHLLE